MKNAQRWSAYELPLNERVRTFMRLEHLFDQFQRHQAGDDRWDSRAAINSLLEILAILGRGDVRSELLKEMEKQAQVLGKLRNRKDVDSARLDNILQTLARLKARLDESDAQIARSLKENEFLAAIRQRNAIPGGTCGFDIPSLQNWLLSPAESRRADLTTWHASLDALERALRLALMLLRESAIAQEHTAQGGYFQQTLESGASIQLIRVLVAPEERAFPEISGGKHRFSIRFMQQHDISQRPKQVQTDVVFRLVSCQL